MFNIPLKKVGFILSLMLFFPWHCSKDKPLATIFEPEEPQENRELQFWIFNDRFDPVALEMFVGEKVTWINKDHQAHTVDSGSPMNPTTEFNSPLLDPNGSYTLSFTRAGTYLFYCSRHPNGKQGRITVK